MIDEINTLISALIENLFESFAPILLGIVYGLTVLRLPVSEITQMVVILVVFSLGINFILSNKQARSVLPK